jgi:hypothetical protein
LTNNRSANSLQRSSCRLAGVAGRERPAACLMTFSPPASRRGSGLAF